VSSAPVRTFTVSFPGHGQHDESDHARRVAEHFGTVHTEVVAEAATVDDLPLLARQYDEPIADSAMVPTHLVARVIRQHAAVALSGDGGDELFAGYPHYRWLLRLDVARRVVPAPLRRSAARAASRWLAPGVRGRHHLIGLAGDHPDSIAHVNLYFDFLGRRRLLAPVEAHVASPSAAPEAYRVGWCRPEHSALRQATEADFRTTLVEAYLVKVDRATMLHSVEMRAPWLDHRLVEFAFGRVPDRLRATASELKILPRRLAARLLPPGLDLSRKWGFTPPLAAWFAGRWGDHVESVLAEADPRLFDRRMIAALVAGQRSGNANAARLFALTLFELWRREYRVTLPVLPDPAAAELRV
jgi:asparagine synthase (glutamine-hydrolysing)